MTYQPILDALDKSPKWEFFHSYKSAGGIDVHVYDYMVDEDKDEDLEIRVCVKDNGEHVIIITRSADTETHNMELSLTFKNISLAELRFNMDRLHEVNALLGAPLKAVI